VSFVFLFYLWRGRRFGRLIICARDQQIHVVHRLGGEHLGPGARWVDSARTFSSYSELGKPVPPRFVFGLNYFGVYIRPFQVTPLPESTFHVEVNIIAANIAAPSGRVNAYHAEIPMLVETRALV
jgi:hypothetical protein